MVLVLMSVVQGGVRGVCSKIYPDFQGRRTTILKDEKAFLQLHINLKYSLSIMRPARGLLDVFGWLRDLEMMLRGYGWLDDKASGKSSPRTFQPRLFFTTPSSTEFD